MTQPAASLPRVNFTARLSGWALDVLLLAIFLLWGVAMLNILIQVIVLCVGAYREFGVKDFDSVGRVKQDVLDLVLTLGLAGAASSIYWGFLKLRRKFLFLFVDAGFESFVSKRYLLSRDSGRLVSLISVVSVLGVAVGVMALIVVLSVMQGFDETLKKKFMGVSAHIEILPDARLTGSDKIPGRIANVIRDKVSKLDGVEGISPILNHETLLQARGGTEESKRPALIRGVDPEREMKVTDFQSYLRDGTAIPGDREIVLGEELARRLSVHVGDRVFALGALAATANRTAAKTLPLKVVGIFRSGLFEIDDKFAYTNIETVQSLRMEGDLVSGLHLRLSDPDDVDRIGKLVVEQLPYGYGYRTWQMLNSEFFAALWVEKVAMFIILLLIVLVAALNIIGTLVMTVLQKTRDIGILKTMGAGSGAVMRIFLSHGFLIGLIGTSLGTAWGLRLCHFVSHDIEKIFKLPGEVYGLDRLPVVIEAGPISFMAGCALAICIGASIIPAFQASRLNPVEALRYES